MEVKATAATCLVPDTQVRFEGRLTGYEMVDKAVKPR
ncbi:hypothetical protein SAMN05216188_11235 [Lentzea xinjiangensis]|uniref:Uncharacterized protein n=1 Tax=Lentzea xinjiangensis TaxID=402600 RepID=A0A1H9PQM7_9PSEU|nr:hypothetical protein SAMN05216188_11235 [Lentzea xinjiangensis]